MKLPSEFARVAIILLLLTNIANAQPSMRRGPSGFDRGRFSDRGRSDRGRGGFGGPPPGGMAARFDTNGDGRIDKAEIESLPEGFRSFMESRGVRPEAGLTVEQFGNSIRQQFEKLRSEGMRRFESEGRPTEDRTPATASATNRSEYRPPEPFRPRDKDRITVDLPPKYSELDTDFDGQVGLYEWVTAKRDELSLFDEIDANADGLLTPRELNFYDEVVSQGKPRLAALQEKYQRPRVTIIGGSSATGSSRSRGKSLLKKETVERHRDFATKKAFPFLDANKDGRITMDELQRDDKTRRTIGMFEKAGIRIGRSMSEREFTDKWIEAQERFEEMKQQGRRDK